MFLLWLTIACKMTNILKRSSLIRTIFFNWLLPSFFTTGRTLTYCKQINFCSFIVKVQGINLTVIIDVINKKVNVEEFLEIRESFWFGKNKYF